MARPGNNRAAAKRPVTGSLLMPESVFGKRFKIKKLLGSGVSGDVYRAFDLTPPPGAETEVAVKIMHPRFLRTAADLSTLRHIIDKAKKLHHVNICRIFEDGIESERVYIDMQLGQGLPLSRILDLRRGQKLFTLEECEPLLGQLCQALDYARRFLVHGSLRPDNILVQPDEIKVTDFATFAGLPRRPYLAALGPLGAYIAPELRHESGQLTPAADVYSLAVILVEMLTGQRPELHKRSAVDAELLALPEELRRFLDRGLEPIASQRIATAAEFYDQFLELLDPPGSGPVSVETQLSVADSLPTRAPPPTKSAVSQSSLSLTTPLDIADTLAVPPRTTGEETGVLSDSVLLSLGVPRSRRSQRPLWIALAIVALGLLAALAVIWVRNPALLGLSPVVTETPVVVQTDNLPVVEPVKPEVSATAGENTSHRPEPASLPASVPAAGTSSLGTSSPAPPTIRTLRSKRPTEPETATDKSPPGGLPTPTPETVVVPTSQPATLPTPVPELNARHDAANRPAHHAERGANGCLKDMVFIPGGRFAMGSSALDEFHNFSDKTLSLVEVHPYCIDRFEFPNEEGEMPVTGVSLHQAKQICETHNKRLCNEDEWERACKGPTNSRFPYGNEFQDGDCNVAAADGKAHGVQASGVAKNCRSGFGIADLSGNVAELTNSQMPGTNQFIVKGGDAAHPDYSSRCAYRAAVGNLSKSSMIGFRCCADPE